MAEAERNQPQTCPAEEPGLEDVEIKLVSLSAGNAGAPEPPDEGDASLDEDLDEEDVDGLIAALNEAPDPDDQPTDDPREVLASLSSLDGEEESPKEPEEEEDSKQSDTGDIFDDIFGEEDAEDDRLKTFSDLEQLTMAEVAAEIEAVLEEIRIRQGD